MGKKFDEQMVCNCSLSRKWWWGSIKVFDSPTKFLVYLDKEGSIDFDQANVKKVTVAYLCNRIDDGGGEFEGTDSHWAVCEPTANGAFAVWEINLSNLYSDPPSPERVCPESNLRILKLQKSTGCFLETVVFSNGKVCACWQTTVPEVAIYENIEQFLSVRTSERGYKILSDSQEK